MLIKTVRDAVTRHTKLVALAAALSVGVAGGFAVAQVGQPHMQAAISALQNAAAQLQQADHDKGGHREKALQLVEQAMRQVEAGMAVGSR